VARRPTLTANITRPPRPSYTVHRSGLCQSTCRRWTNHRRYGWCVRDGLIVSVKDIAQSKQLVATARSAHSGDSFKLIANRWSVYAQTDNDAWQALQSQRGLRAPSRDRATNPWQLQIEADNLPRADIMSRYARLRSPADYLAHYGPLVTELGADIIGIQTTALNQIETIAC